MFQTDTILLRYGIDEFLSKNLNYLGAPYRKRENTFIGNGGLSLRKNLKCYGLLTIIQTIPSHKRIFIFVNIYI